MITGSSNVLLNRFVAGSPASFATRGERPWKEALRKQLSDVPVKGSALSLELDFSIAPRVGYAEGADLDNLCEPVFSVLVNQLGWFGARRSNIQAFRARKALTTPTGCRVVVRSGQWADSWLSGDVLFNLETDIPLPRSARDAAFAEWVAGGTMRPARLSTRLTVSLSFANPINLGDIATGRLKNVIDCLYPVIGGRPGAPSDDRIAALEVSRHHSDARGTILVRVAEAPLERP
jgi:hypothetical protein